MMEFRPAKLRKGMGNGDPADGLCLMQMVDWFSGSDCVTDHPQCASPVLCKVGIELNDLASPRQREMLWPLVWRLIDSNDVPEVEQKRCEYLVREVTHRLIVPMLDHIGHHINTVQRWCDSFDQVDVAEKMLFSASALRTAESLQDIEIAARIVSGINHGFLQVSFLTDITATAARTVMAMPAFPELRCEHHSNSYRREAVAEFVTRAIGVPKQFGAKRKTWSTMRDIFEETIMLGRHGEQDPVAYEPRARQLEKLLTPA